MLPPGLDFSFGPPALARTEETDRSQYAFCISFASVSVYGVDVHSLQGVFDVTFRPLVS